MAASDAPPSSSTHGYGFAAVVFVGSALWLSLRTPTPLMPDTARDLAFARELADGAADYGHGAWSAFFGLVQGTSWIDLLAFAYEFGVTGAGLDHLFSFLLALTVALAAHGFARLLAPSEHQAAHLEGGRLAHLRPAIVASLVYLALLPGGIEIPLLWQPVLLPLPILLAHLSLWRLARSGAWAEVFSLPVLAAFALDVHVAAVLFVGLALVSLALFAPRPLLAPVLGVLIGAGSLHLLSSEMLPDNIARLDELGLLWPALVVGVVAVGGAAAARVRLGMDSLDAHARLRLLCVLELGLLLALVLASLLDSTPSLSGRYLAVFAPTLALAAGGLCLTRTTRQQSLACLGLALAGLALSVAWLRPRLSLEPPVKPAWKLVEFEPLAAQLHEEGLTWSEAVLRVQGSDRDTLLGHLGVVLDPGELEPERPDAGLLFLRLDSEQLELVRPELGDQLRTISLGEGRGFAALVDTPGRVGRHGAQICRDEGSECVGVTLAVARRVYQAHPNAWVEDLSVGEWVREDGRGEPTQLRWHLPLRAGEPAFVQFSERLPERCAWQIVATEGFELEQALPSPSAALPPAAAGMLVVTREVDERVDECTSSSMPPDLLETHADWRELQALLEVDPGQRADG